MVIVTMNDATILWLRSDLRLADHPALCAAVKRGSPVIPVFIWSPDEEGTWNPGGAGRWWLHHSLESLATALQKEKSRLIIREGDALDELQTLIAETGATAVYWSRRYEPYAIKRDAVVKASLKSGGIEARSFNASLLFEPWDIANRQGGPFQVFTPFYRRCLTLETPAEPLPAPRAIPPPDRWPESLRLDALNLEPRVHWADGIAAAWQTGEKGAREELERFLDEAMSGYDENRDIPSTAGTSRMSPYLHHGEISPRQIWHAVKECEITMTSPGLVKGAASYLRQLVWREFAHHLLFHFPYTPTQPLRNSFQHFPWGDDPDGLKAWQRGQTGYPIVDAGMRELWSTGWMHNRVRMIAASFLVKDLLVPWQEGAEWFRDTLVDADLANNTLGWQWTAGCGADAAPYFRIFNPVTQGQKFDAGGHYVRKWIPEISGLPDKYIHSPWTAPEAALREARVELDKDYPCPRVNHAEARERALEAYRTMRNV